MSKEYYNFRVSVAGDNSVKIQEWGTNDASPEEKPAGLFHAEKVFGNEEIEGLIEAANQDTLADGEQVRQLGEALCEALFEDRLLNIFIDSYKKYAEAEDQLFRCELDIDEQAMPHVAALPWEFMCLPEKVGRGELWVATAPKMIFSRRRALWDKAEPIQLAKDEKLRIMLVISAPRDEAIVDYEPVEQALKYLVEDKPEQIDLVVVNPAQFGAVDEALRKHKPHIFHFVGHGQLLDENDEAVGQLAFMNDMRRAKWINANEFSERFTQHMPGILMLQACEGGKLASSKAFVGVASKVVQQNIPVVVAMQYEVTNDTAIEFASRFYWELADGVPVDVAAQLGRRAIANGPYLHRTRDFATPVIFMRVRNGYLFQRPEDTTTETLGSPVPETNVIKGKLKVEEAKDVEGVGAEVGTLNSGRVEGEIEVKKAKNAKLTGAKVDSVGEGSGDIKANLDIDEDDNIDATGVHIGDL